MSSKRSVLRPGAVVVGRDGGLGWVDALLATPHSDRISGFVLREGLLFNRSVLVPIEVVERTDDSRVHVRSNAAQLNSLADSHLRDATRRPETRLIRAGQRVVCRDGPVGSLILILADPASHRVTHLVVGQDDSPGRAVTVPIAWVHEMTDDPIAIDARSTELESLPEYRPDDEITDAVARVLWYRSGIDPADLRHVRVRTHDGIVRLTGKTRTEQSRLAVEELVRRVRGVLGVRNELRTFEALGAAAQALRQQALRQQALRQQALRQQALRQQALRQQALRQQALRQQGGAADGRGPRHPEPVLPRQSGVGSAHDGPARPEHAVAAPEAGVRVPRPFETVA